MNLFFNGSNFVLIFLLCGQISGFPSNSVNDVKVVCKLMADTYNSLDRIFRKQDSFEDSDYSVGFHLTEQFCREAIEDNGYQPMFRALTAYKTSDNHMILFFNLEVIINGTDNTINMNDIERLRRWGSNLSTLTVIWIKVLTGYIPKSSLFYEITYRSKSGQNRTIKTSDLKESLRNNEQLILDDIQTNPNNKQEFFITPAIQNTTGSHSIDDTYVIICLVRDKKENSNCRPVLVSDHGLSCECDINNQYMTLAIWCLFWIIFICIAIKPLISSVFAVRPGKARAGQEGQTDFLQLVSCNMRTAVYEYMIGIRLAKGSADFDLTDVNIDIEFKTVGNQSVAPALRFRANVLDNQIVTQIRILMSRLTKLPELRKVQCSHSGKYDGVITLLTVFVYCKKGFDDYKSFNAYRIFKNIVRENRELPLVKEDPNADNFTDEELIYDKILSNFQINYTFLEFSWILFINISLIGFMANIIGKFGIRYDSSYYMSEMFGGVIISALVAVIFNVVLIQIYKFLLFKQLKQKWKMNTKSDNFFQILIYGLYGLSIMVSVGMGIFVCLQNTSLKQIQVFKWLCVTICASALFLMIWTFGYRVYTIMVRKSKDNTHSDNQSEDISTMSVSSESAIVQTNSIESEKSN